MGVSKGAGLPSMRRSAWPEFGRLISPYGTMDEWINRPALEQRGQY